ncbi:MAG: permease [Hydrogenobacter thermophilus]|nr:MAG: permease [Hydrogenobacter thermophilus]
MSMVSLLLSSFYQYSIEILPYFLFAALITSLIQAYVNLNLLRRFLTGSKLAPVFTASFGGLLPLCSCSMVPVAQLINHLSKNYSSVVAFLMVAPVVSPITVTLTYGFFGLKMALLRVFATLVFALVVAYAMDALFKKNKGPSLHISTGRKSEKKAEIFVKSLRYNLFFTGRYLLIGIAIASLIKTFVPIQVVKYIAGSPLSYPLISLVSIPIYVCSGEDVPIAKALAQIGFTHGNAFTFMLASSGICMPTILAVKSFLPGKVVLAYAVSWFLLSTLLGFAIDVLF